MNIYELTILLFSAMLLALAAGAPVGFSLGGIAMIFGFFLWGPSIFGIITQTANPMFSSFILLACPLYIYMGQILQKSGLAEAMFHAMHMVSGRLRGGLAIGVILVCTMVAAMVGIIGAGIALAGSVALPPMLKRGYNLRLCLGSIMSGGGMGILIPPSIPMILFATMTNVSIGKMFIGGVGPGLVMSSLFIMYIGIRCYINPSMGPALNKEELGSWKDKVIAVRDGGLAFGLIFVCLGSIIMGVATPTEAAALGVMGTILITLIYRRFSWSNLWEATKNSMRLNSMIIWILIGASVFSNFHMFMGAGKLISSGITDFNLSPFAVIVLMQLTMILMGCIIDDLIIVIICAPLFTPIAIQLGYDPVWFGILMILNLEIAIMTPPYGFALFYMKAFAPEGVTMLEIYKSITPFLIIKFFVLGLVMVFPDIATWLPHLVFD